MQDNDLEAWLFLLSTIWEDTNPSLTSAVSTGAEIHLQGLSYIMVVAYLQNSSVKEMNTSIFLASPLNQCKIVEL